MINGSDKTVRFVAGSLMLAGGMYLFLQAIHVNFGFNYPLYRFGNARLTAGYVLIPFMLGIGMIFYNMKNSTGWFLTFGSLAAIVLGVVSSTQMRLRNMSAFELMAILILMIGGLGLFLSALRNK